MSSSPLGSQASPPGDAWSTAPIDSTTAQMVQHLLRHLDVPQRLWVSGLLAGSALSANLPASPESALPPAAATPVAAEPVTILFGSQSGNCERLANQLSQSLTQRGIAHVALDMIDCRKDDLQNARWLLVLVSTHGEGDPPDRALPLHELLHGRKAPKLQQLKYSVLALGDSSYEKFCETGRQFDARLAALGASAFRTRTDCDVEYENAARDWIDGVVEHIAREQSVAADNTPVQPARALAAVATAYTRKNPFHAPLLLNQRLTARDSDKDVRHIELSLEDSGIHYEPGDALGVVVRNAPEDVDALLRVLPYDAHAPVSQEGAEQPLHHVLQNCDIGLLTRTFTTKYLERIGHSEAPNPTITQLIDLVAAHPPANVDAAAFVQLLRPLAPRLYSIASSPRATPDEVHLTVAIERYELDGKLHTGVASRLFEQLQGDDVTAPVYLHRNPGFRLPADPEAPIIMIGPGTGIAPFRGFIADRAATGARGRNWLFFGERRFRSDFLYQAEWLDYRKRGVLHRVELAFSRDQPQKIYVQQRLQEHGRELYAWLQDGAYLYVCGDAQRMAHDVNATLLQILAEHGGHSPERAAEELVELQRARRYQRDVY